MMGQKYEVKAGNTFQQESFSLSGACIVARDGAAEQAGVRWSVWYDGSLCATYQVRDGHMKAWIR